MRFHLELEKISFRGAERPRDPVLWPVWFAVDDAALRSLAGDPTADPVHSPGPIRPPARGAISRWDRAVSANALPPEHALVGFGLLLTAGGLESAPVWDAYQELADLLHALALTETARAAHFLPLLEAFGAEEAKAEADRAALLAALREGLSPEALRRTVDAGLRERLGALRGVGHMLGRLLPEASPTPRAAAEAAVLAGLRARDITASLPETGRPGPGPEGTPAGARPEPPFPIPGPLLPGGLPPGAGRIPVPGPAGIGDLPDGTVVAGTVQAWRTGDLPPGRTTRIDRPLPALRTMRASLALSGSIHRED
jgi:hypothetical protein